MKIDAEVCKQLREYNPLAIVHYKGRVIRAPILDATTVKGEYVKVWLSAGVLRWAPASCVELEENTANE